MGEETVESVYTVTITNTGDERALGANEVQRIVKAAAKNAMPDEQIAVHVEAH